MALSLKPLASQEVQNIFDTKPKLPTFHPAHGDYNSEDFSIGLQSQTKPKA